MFRKLLERVGLAGGAGDRPAAAPSTPAAPPYAPYADAALNHIYNLLFCDDPTPFRPRPGSAPAPWQATLFGSAPSADAVAQLANDATAEGRVRALAFNWLRRNGRAVAAKQLLGVIIEARLPGGLDVLAAFSEGGVRYINQTGKTSFFEGVTSLQPLVTALLEAAAAVVAQIGPSDKPRRPPPGGDHVRLTFLVSDGLYFGEGQMASMQREALGGPLLQKAGALLQAVVDLATP